MKKLFLILLITFSVFSLSFADTVYLDGTTEDNYDSLIGISSGFNQYVYFDHTGPSSTRQIVPIELDTMSYFGRYFALNASVGVDIYLPSHSGGSTDFGVVANIIAYFNIPLSNFLNFMVGGGLTYHYQPLYVLGPRYSASDNSFAVTGSVRIELSPVESLVVFVSGNVGYNFASTISEEFYSWYYDYYHVSYYENHYMPWSIKAGLGFRF